MWSSGCCQNPCANKNHWIITINGKMNVWKFKLIFPTDTLQQNIEITYVKPFLAVENTSVLIILATTVRSSCVSALSPPLGSPLAVLELQRWWIHPNWAGRCHKGHSADCWEPLPLLVGSCRWSCPGESPYTPYRWWSTASRLSCWSLL